MEEKQLATGNVTGKRIAKKKKNQLPAALLLLVLVIGFAVLLARSSAVLAIPWIFGIAFGVVLQRSRFCFTAAFRDPLLTGSTSLLKAVLIAIAVALVGFAFIQANAVKHGLAVPGSIRPAGWHVVLGATIFGIGAVISGGCASGTLMRFGEGFQMQWLSLVFFVVGSIWGAHDFGWWHKLLMQSAPSVHLPSVMGWPLAIGLQLAGLGLLYFLAERWGKRQKS